MHSVPSVPSVPPVSDPLRALRAWEPILAQAYAGPIDGHAGTIADGHRIVRRSDDGSVLGAVGATYSALSHADFCATFDSLAEAGVIRSDAIRCGTFAGGRRIWAQAPIADRRADIAGQPVQGLLTLLDSHDGTASLAALDSAVNIVCANTWQRAHRQGRGMRLRHCATVAQRWERIRQELLRTSETWRESVEEWRDLTRRPMAFDSFRSTILDRIAPMPEGPQATDRTRANAQRTRDRLSWAWEAAPGAMPGTRYGAWQAVTYWATHDAGRESSRLERTMHGPQVAQLRAILGDLLTMGGAN